MGVQKIVQTVCAIPDAMEARITSMRGGRPDFTAPGKSSEPDKLLQHIVGSFLGLHKGTFLIALLFPILVPLIGWMLGVSIQNSLSAYFFALIDKETFSFFAACSDKSGSLICALAPKAGASGQLQAVFPVRMVFTGFLLAIAACLYFYKGFTNLENRLLNVAALGALIIAIFPEHHDIYNTVSWSWMHFVGVAVLFLCVAFVCWYCSGDTVPLLPKPRQAHYNRLYGLTSSGMVLMLGLGFALFKLGLAERAYVILVLEFIAIEIFAFYWLVKHWEMNEHKLIADNRPINIMATNGVDRKTR